MGLRHGTWKSYYENGQQYNVAEYKDGKAVGELRHWYDSGAIQSIDILTYDKGELSVSHIAYHANGPIRERGTYVRQRGETRSVRSGKWEYFDKEGRQTQEEHFVNGIVQARSE